jgi:hypothetical protein
MIWAVSGWGWNWDESGGGFYDHWLFCGYNIRFFGDWVILTFV